MSNVLPILRELEKQPAVKDRLAQWRAIEKKLAELDGEVQAFEKRKKQALEEAEQLGQEADQLDDSWREAVSNDDEKEADSIRHKIEFKQERARQAREKAKVFEEESLAKVDAIAKMQKSAKQAAGGYWREVLLASKKEARDKAAPHIALVMAAHHLWHAGAPNRLEDRVKEIFTDSDGADLSELSERVPVAEYYAVFRNLSCQWRAEKRAEDYRLGRVHRNESEVAE